MSYKANTQLFCFLFLFLVIELTPTQSAPRQVTAAFKSNNEIRQVSLTSNFFKGDTIAESIIHGKEYALLASKFDPTMKIDVTSFEFKVINALRQIGFSRMEWTTALLQNPSSAGINRFRTLNGLRQSDSLDCTSMVLLDQKLRQREILDSLAANKYPPFSKFYHAAVNEPSPEHLAMVLSGFFSCLPENINTNCKIGDNELVGNVWSVDQFRNAVVVGLGRNLGYLMDEKGTKVLSNQEAAEMVGTHVSNFKFCAAGTGSCVFYCGYTVDGDSVAQNSKALIDDDFNYICLIQHEYAHALGSAMVSYNEMDCRTDVLFGDISFDLPLNQNFTPVTKRKRQDDSEFISGYGATNNLEDFAESFVAYIVTGKIFREKASHNIYLQQKYDFLNARIFKGKEFETGDIARYNLFNTNNGNKIPFHPEDYLMDDPTWTWDYQYPVKSSATDISEIKKTDDKQISFRLISSSGSAFLNTFEFVLPYSVKFYMNIYNLYGRKVALLQDKNSDKGLHRITWDSRSFSTGTYFAKLQFGSQNNSMSFRVIR